MAGELVETSRLWARQNAAIKPEWAERLGGHLVKRTYSEPHWSKKRAAVMAYERVTLYGVPLVADRLVSYGKVDPALSPRAVHPARAGLRRVAHAGTGSTTRTCGCSRRPRSSSTGPGAAASSSTSTPCSTSTTPGSAPRSSAARTSTRWWKRERQQRPDLLTFDPEMLTHDTRRARSARRTTRRRGAAAAEGPDLPDQLPLRAGRGRRRADHRRPGGARSTRSRPTTSPGTCPACARSWSPSLIRSLPKNLRVNFVPAPNTRARVPRRRPAGRRAAARRARALLPLDHRRGRAARGLGLGQGARAPAPDLPGRRRGRRRAGPRQGPGGAQGAAAAAVRRGDGRGGRRQRRHAHRRDDLDLRHRRESFTQTARRPRGARLSRARRRGRDRRAAGVRLRGRGRGPAPARRPPAAAPDASDARSRDPRRADQRREARPGRVAVPLRRRAARGLPGRASSWTWSTRGRRCGTSRRTTRSLRTSPPRLRGAPDRGRGRRAARARRLAARREGSQRPGRHAHAPGADGHAGPARPAGAPRLRRRGRRRPAPALPDLPRRARAAPASSSTSRSPATAS